MILVMFAATQGFAQGNFHFIFMGKTDDPDIGRAVQADAQLADSLFKYIEREADIIKVTPHFFTGKKYSNEYIRNFIDTLQLSASDKVFMIIDNHGARFDGLYSRFPMVQLPFTVEKANNVFDYYSLKGIHDTLVKKGAEFVFTIGIMCNSYQNLVVGSKRDLRIQELLANDNPDRRLIQRDFTYQTKYDSISSLLKLFQLAKGQILMNSGDRTQLTYYNDIKGHNKFGSLALHAIFDEFTGLKGKRNADGPVQIGSNLLNRIKNEYTNSVGEYLYERGIDQNNNPIKPSDFIYKARINGVSFDHTDEVIEETYTPPPPCDRENIVAKGKSLIVDLLRDLQIRYQQNASYETDFYSKFKNNGGGITIGLVKGLRDQTAIDVPVSKYYKDYIVNNKGYKKVQISLKDSTSLRVFGPHLINGFSQTNPNIDRYELRVEFTQVYVGLSSAECIEYKDETWKTAVIYVFVDKNSCFIEDAYIVEIFTEDGNIRPLSANTIYAFDPVSQSNKAYNECSRKVGN